MAADLHIHVLEGASESDLAVFHAHTLGTKYFDLTKRYDPTGPEWERVGETPNVWVGEVSWLKAAVFGEAETFIPSTVQKVHEIIGEDLPVIDDGLIERIKEAFTLDNVTSYGLAECAKVTEFLEAHRGKQAFTVSW
jgi:hypothetical protein